MAFNPSGSWSVGGFQLPDFGITEAIGGALGQGNNTQGGSNIVPNNVQNAANYINPVPFGNFSSNNPTGGYQTGSIVDGYRAPGDVLGTTKTQTPPPGGNGGSGGGGSTQTTSTQQTQTADPFMQALNSAYGGENDYLNQAESTLRGAQPGILNTINSDVNTSESNLKNSQNDASSQIDLSAKQGQQRQQDALTAARRLYNELIQGGQQRFGGASSAGEAYQALAGRELQQNNQQTSTDYNTFMGQIQQAKSSLQSQYTSALSTLEQKRQDALQQAQQDFNDKLLSIQHDRTMADQDKANTALQALQDLRNNVYQINVAQAQNTGTLQKLAQDANSQLESATQTFMQQQQNAGQGLNTFGQATTTNPNTGLSLYDPNSPQQVMQTGYVDPNKKYDQFGNPIS